MRNLRPVPELAERACIYIRQSVERDDSISAELQEIACRDYATTHGYDVVDVVVDLGKTGRTTNRRQINAVVDKVTTGEYAVILVWKWSRVSRSRTDWAILADRVAVAGGRIESATEPIDTATASGRFARGVMTEYAAFQSEQIGEQWAEVHRRRFNMGLSPNGAYPWGWIGDKDTLTPDPETAPAVQELYRRYIAGDGWTRLAKWLNESGHLSPRGKAWTQTTVRSLLDCPIHAGYVTYHGEIRDGAHEGIITRQEWELYRSLRAKRLTPKKQRMSDYLLSSLVVCHCGQKRSGKITRNRRRDGHIAELYSYACYSNPHPKMSILTRYVDETIGEWVKTEAAKPATIPPERSTKTEITRLSREITELEKQLVKATRHLYAEVISEAAYRATREEIEAEQAVLQRALEEAKLSITQSPTLYLSGKEQLIASWDVLTFDERQSIVRAAIETVTINPDRTVTIVSKWGSISVMEV